ncbi:DUF4097 family beta strand repeat-containing protein [Alkaliphilus crotonatoxidans]
MKDSRQLKNIVLALFVIMIGSFAIGGSLLAIFIPRGVEGEDYNSNLWSFKNNLGTAYEHKVNQEEVINITDISNITISTDSVPIRLYVVEGTDELKAHYYGSVQTNGAPPELELKQSGNKIVVRENRREKMNVGFNFENLSMDIYLPKQYQKELSLHSISGDVLMDKLQLSKIEAETISGKISLDGAILERGFFKSTSGNIEINHYLGELRGETVSGHLAVELAGLEDKVDINSISGDIKVALPSDSSFKLMANSTSGKITSDFPMTVNGKSKSNTLEGIVGKGEHELELKTISGNINIRY